MFRESQKIGSYTLISKLGKGGFGEVWLAEKRSQFVSKRVAVKLPLDEQVDFDAIRQEATLWEQASGHANVLPIIDADIFDGQVVIVSEYADGGSLHDKLETEGKLPIKLAVETTIGILNGLEFLHNKRIIHRDIKPQNILLQGNTPRLADFGISRAMQTTAISSNIVGTDAYMSPESFRGLRTIETDIWSVGVVLYQLLNGRLPFPQVNPSEKMYAILQNEFAPLSIDIPQGLRRIVEKSLAKLPENRYASANEMCKDLQQTLRDDVILSTSNIEQKNLIQQIPSIQFQTPTLETVVKPPKGITLTPKSKSQTFKKKQSTIKDYSRVNEIIAVILVALAVLTFFSLMTSSPNDWSLNTDSLQETQNWVGIVGAVIADLLFQTIGSSAYFVPALLGLSAWRFFRAKGMSISITRVIGYLLLIFSLSSFTYLLGFTGGVVGAFSTHIFSSWLGSIGTGILVSLLFLSSLLLITNPSIISIFSDFELAWRNFKMRFEDYFKRHQNWRETRNRSTIERLEKRRRISEAMTEAEIVVNKKVKPPEQIDDSVDVLTTIAPPEAKPKTEVEKLPTTIQAEDLIGDALKIPIYPVKETAELESRLLDEFNDEVVFRKLEKTQNYDNYILPETEILISPQPRIEQKDEDLLATAQEITEKAKEFNVSGRVMHICQGPVVTTYEFKPDPGVKYSRVLGLSDELSIALKTESIRIERIPGKAFVGIEIPNRERETIFLREVIESKKFQSSKSLLTLALGKTIDGLNYVVDLAKMRNLLIVGDIISGKSSCIHTIITSILYKAKPDEVKFIMVDPKRLEFGLYSNLPHLATPIISDSKHTTISLKWAVSEMEKRYEELERWGIRNIDGFNTEVKKRNTNKQFNKNGEPYKTLPYIIIIIDEIEDLVVSNKEIEDSISLLAQQSYIVGIHLVLTTQRPSIKNVANLIKTNFPSRIALHISSKVDSRSILNSDAATQLLGRSDMLFLPPATSQIVRVHGAYLGEKEIQKIVDHIKLQGKPYYDETITKSEEKMDESGDLLGRNDPLFADALQCVVSSKRASTSLLQRHLRIGYGRAAAILDALVAEGYIGEMDGNKRARPILQKAYKALKEAEEGREN